MKMTMNKVSRAALAGLMVCGLALSAAPALNVAPETVRATAVSTLPDEVTVQINKKFIDANYELQQNTGEELAWMADFDPVEEVEFSAYDVTDIYYELRAKPANAGVTAKELTDEIIADWATTHKSKATFIKSDKTDDKGIIDFTGLKTRNEAGQYKMYLFEEGNSLKTNLLRSVPMIVGMPVRNVAKDKFLDTIKIYPKNTGLEKELTNLNGNSTDGTVYNYEVGQELHYETNFVIPHGIREAGTKFKSINLTDMMSAVGTTLVGEPSITIEGDDEDLHDYFVAAGAYTDSNDTGWSGHAGFKYTIDMTAGSKESEINALLEKIEGKALSVKYTMKINKHAVPNQDIGNTFTGKFGNEPEMTVVDESQKVETSGHKFTKYDAYDENQGLPDAEFKLQNSDGDWAILNNPGGEDGTYKPESIRWGTKAEATTLKSAAEGHLQINGLESGSYTLVETKAPTGYQITTTDTNFTVAKGMLTTTALGSDTIANTPLDGELPLTGGMGIAAFLIVGTAAMGTAVIYKKRHA